MELADNLEYQADLDRYINRDMTGLAFGIKWAPEGRHPEKWARTQKAIAEGRTMSELNGRKLKNAAPTPAPTLAPTLANPVTQNASSGEYRDMRHDESAGTIDATARSRREIKSLADLLTLFEVDGDVWEVKTWACRAWEGFVKNADNEPEVVGPLYSVSAKFARKKVVAEAFDLAAFLEARAANHSPVYTPPIVLRRAAEPRMLEFIAPDLHLGKLAWAPESGEHYDTRIASGIFEEAVDYILACTEHEEFDRILFPVGNDLFQSDNIEGTTTKGTPQSVDGRYHRTFDIGFDLMVSTIERFMGRAPEVHVVIVSGNHDYHTAWHLGHSLKSWFRHAENVAIDNAPMQQKYHRYGKVLLGFTHGDKEAPRDLPLLMLHDRPQDMADTWWHEWHLGHLHKRREDEFMGVGVKVFESLCAADDWHRGRAYIAPLRRARGIVWDKVRGEVGCHTYSVPRDGRYSK